MSDLSTASDTFGDQPVQALNQPAESLVVGASGPVGGAATESLVRANEV